jgi:hypothetical protein
MKVRRGEVVLVDFPYSDHTGSKVRPALVVQADAWNQRLDDTILALITSSRHRRVGAATQLVIDITTAEGQQTGHSGSTRSFNAKICSHMIKISFCVSWVISRLQPWSRLTPVSNHWRFRSDADFPQIDKP